MIQSIKLTNFQAHKELSVDFATGVTTIIGPSDRGKSAILRAIRWVCLNEPAGNSFMMHGTNYVSVELVIDGVVIARSASKNENTYEIRPPADSDDLHQTYKAFGRDVPAPIADFLRASGLNFQGQHDAPFWFTETAGEVSRQLNQIVNLDLIDKTLATIASKLKKARIISAEHADMVEDARQAHIRLRQVSQLKKDHDAMRLTAARKHTLHDDAAALRRLTDEVSCVDDNLKTTAGVRPASLAVSKQGEQLKIYTNDAERLTSLIKDVEEAEDIAAEVVPCIEPIEIVHDYATKTRAEADCLAVLVEDAYDVDDKLPQLIEDLSEAKEELKKVSKGRCPLCGEKLQNPKS